MIMLTMWQLLLLISPFVLMPPQDIICNGVDTIIDGIEHYNIEKDVIESEKTISDATVYLYSD